MLKTFALESEPVEYTDRPEPILAMIATGSDIPPMLGWATGRTGPTEQILDAGMLLEYQLEHPGRGQAAQELLTEIGAPDGLLDQIRALASGSPVTAPEHAKAIRDWAWDMITAPGGVVDRMPELAIPVGGPQLGEKSGADHAADLKRMYLHLGAIWAVGMLAELTGHATTDLLDEILRRRAVRAADRRRPALAGVA